MPVDANDLEKMGVRKFMLFIRTEDGRLWINVNDLDIDPNKPIYHVGISPDGEQIIANMSLGTMHLFAMLTEADLTAQREGGESAPGYGP